MCFQYSQFISFDDVTCLLSMVSNFFLSAPRGSPAQPAGLDGSASGVGVDARRCELRSEGAKAQQGAGLKKDLDPCHLQVERSEEFMVIYGIKLNGHLW